MSARPFYVIGHNTNTPEEVEVALRSGANAVEVDVTAYGEAPDQLCVAHRGLLGDGPGRSEDPALVDFLQALRRIADANPERLALVMFDVKSPAATAELGAMLHAAIREHLVDPTNPIGVLVAAASLDNAALFRGMAKNLRAREALSIDEETDPRGVESHFRDALAAGTQCFGCGSSFWGGGRDKFRDPLRSACEMRAKRERFRFVYAWTVNDAEDQADFVRMGVDGIIADPHGCSSLTTLLSSELAPVARLAARVEDPFFGG